SHLLLSIRPAALTPWGGPWHSFRAGARCPRQYRSGWWKGSHDPAIPGSSGGRPPCPEGGWQRNGAAHGGSPRVAGQGPSAALPSVSGSVAATGHRPSPREKSGLHPMFYKDLA